MILGVVLAKKRYPLQKYFFVLLIVLGVALFMFKDKSGSGVDSDHVFGFGEILLVSARTSWFAAYSCCLYKCIMLHFSVDFSTCKIDRKM